MPHAVHLGLKLFAAALGAVLVGVPILLFNIWINKQGDDEISQVAANALAAAELRLDRAVAVLNDLALRGAESCRPADIEAMREAVLATSHVKDIILVAADGRISCAALGGRSWKPVSVQERLGAKDGVVLDVVSAGGHGERFVRIRNNATTDGAVLTALAPGNLLVPLGTLDRGESTVEMRLSVGDSVVLRSGGARAAAHGEARVVHQARSARYPISVTMSIPQGGAFASYADFRRIGVVVTGTVALVILLCTLILFRRQAATPIAAMAKAILANEFVPYYQPVVDIRTGRLLGAEVLVRWRREDGSLIEPIDFVSVMETSGLLIDLTRTLMRRVRGDLSAALGQRPHLTIAFNIAPQHLDDALILNDVGTIFDGSGIKLSQIVLELTERYRVGDLANTRRTIAALQGLGCKVALDDVGTGRNGLSYILKLGVDIIKIDRVLVEALAVDSRSHSVVATLIDLAKNMRMQVVAEGVETFDQITDLRERGVTAAQGYVFAPPLPAASFLKLLDALDPAAATPGIDAGRSGARRMSWQGAVRGRALTSR